VATGSIDRRDFLRAGALGAAGIAVGAGLAGCQGTAAPASEAVGDSTTDPGAATPAQWRAYAASLKGRLVRPGDRAYPIDKLLFNPRFDALAPVAVAYCASAGDVARSIGFARDHGFVVAVRSGGHSYGGYSSGSGRLVMDVTPMAAVVPASAPGGTAMVGTGARLIDVYNVLGGHGQLVPGGSCPTVGIAGLTLGGGVGVFARRYGLAADNLAAVTLVTAEGAVRRCSPEHDEALFWACRGGGGGNFGVATSFEFTTHAIPPVTLFTYDFAWSAAHDVLGEWQHWNRSVNDAVWSNCQLLSGGGTTVRVAGVSCARSGQTAAWLAPLLARLPAPTYHFLGNETYVNEMMVEAGCSGLTVAACHLDTTFPHGVLSRQAFAASSNYVAAPMSDARLGAVVSVVNQLAAELPELGGGLVFDALGGAVNTVAPTETAFVHRRFLASIQSSYNWTGSTPPSTVAAGARWLAHVRAAVYDPANGAYQNYIDPTLGDFAAAYYGGNLPRLSGIKRAYDPDGVFRFAQSVPPR
jgi:FAD/FMN-containing dehydrogenase